MAKDERVTLEEECFRLIQVASTVLIPPNLIGDPFVTAEAQLSEAMPAFEVHLVAGVEMSPSAQGWYADGRGQPDNASCLGTNLSILSPQRRDGHLPNVGRILG